MGYESREAAEIIGVPERNFRYWATSRAFIPEEDAVGRQGGRRKYSFKNLVEAAIIRDLTNLNVSVPQAAAAISKLQGKDFISSSFCFLIITANGEVKVITDDDARGELDEKKQMIEDIPNKLLADIVGREFEEQYRSVHLYMWTELVTMESSVVIPVHKVRIGIEAKLEWRAEKG